MNKISYILIAIILMSLRSMGGTIWDDGGFTYNWSEARNWNKPDGIPASGANVSFGSSGTYVTTDINPTVGLITLSRNANFSINGPGTITVNTGITTSRNNRTYTINAPIVFGNNNTWTNLNFGTVVTVNGAVNTAGYNLTVNTTSTVNLNSAVVSSGELIKNGNGTLNINTNNEQFGSLTVNDGTLGIDYKTITCDGNVTFNGGTLRVSVGDAITYGQVVAGNITIGDINLGSGITNLFLSSVGYSALDTDRIWIMINNSDGLTTGYFNGLTEGTAVIVGGQTMYIRYGADYASGGSFGGNDVMLCIPEPSSMMIFFLGSSLLFIRRKKGCCVS